MLTLVELSLAIKAVVVNLASVLIICSAIFFVAGAFLPRSWSRALLWKHRGPRRKRPPRSPLMNPSIRVPRFHEKCPDLYLQDIGHRGRSPAPRPLISPILERDLMQLPAPLANSGSSAMTDSPRTVRSWAGEDFAEMVHQTTPPLHPTDKVSSTEAALLAECSAPVFSAGRDGDDWEVWGGAAAQQWRSWRGSGDEVIWVTDAARRRRENLTWRIWFRQRCVQHTFRPMPRAQTEPAKGPSHQEDATVDIEMGTPSSRHGAPEGSRHGGMAGGTHPATDTPRGHVSMAVPVEMVDAVRHLLSNGSLQPH